MLIHQIESLLQNNKALEEKKLNLQGAVIMDLR
jgi:hypothetical protein